MKKLSLKKTPIVLMGLMTTLNLFGEIDYVAAERTVLQTFDRVLNREPSTNELYHYVFQVVENRWTYSDLRREIRGASRNSGNRYSSRNSFQDRDFYEARRWVESGFEEYVGRLPTRAEMEEYCDICLEDRLDQRGITNLIRRDYEGIYEPYRSDSDYHYEYDRYADNEEVELIITDVYTEILGRDPDTEGMRNYRTLMLDKGWSERRLREHLANSPEVLWERYSKYVNRAYEDLLEREPSRREVDAYVDDMIRHKWDERKLRDMIRRSNEYQYDRPKKLIEKAYTEVLLRDPDASAYDGLRREIVRKEWTYAQVKDHLMKSSEYKNVTIPKMVRLAYQEVLEREPDADGQRFYLSRARQGWTFEEIKQHMKDSEEYRSKR